MKKIIILAFLFTLSNCTWHMGNFKEFAPEAPTNLEQMGGNVTGEHCLWRPFTMRGWYSASLAEATRQALALAPGATGLKDATVTGHHESIIFACVKVEGIPVKETGGGSPATPAKKKTK